MAGQQDLEANLERLGLKRSEAAVYLAALEQSRASVLRLARATGLKRGTVYEVTERLLDRGFLREVREGKRRTLVAENPRTLVERFNREVADLTTSLPKLLALQNLNTRQPTITYFDGEAEVWQIYEGTLSAQQPILSFTSVIGVYDLLDPYKIERYIARRTELKIPVRIIALDSVESRRWAKRAGDELRDIRLIPREQAQFVADVEIFGDRVAIVSFKRDLFGIVIESEQIATMFRAAFELMWQAAVPTDPPLGKR